jgi:hypothetical protein
VNPVTSPVLEICAQRGKIRFSLLRRIGGLGQGLPTAADQRGKKAVLSATDAQRKSTTAAGEDFPLIYEEGSSGRAMVTIQTFTTGVGISPALPWFATTELGAESFFTMRAQKRKEKKLSGRFLFFCHFGMYRSAQSVSSITASPPVPAPDEPGRAPGAPGLSSSPWGPPSQ